MKWRAAPLLELVLQRISLAESTPPSPLTALHGNHYRSKMEKRKRHDEDEGSDRLQKVFFSVAMIVDATGVLCST